MATADKLTTVAENVPKVYNAGLTSFVNAMSDGGTNFSGMFAYFTEAQDEDGGYTLYINRPKFTTIPLIDTSKGIDFSYMFACCKNLTTIPQLDTSNGINFNHMFFGCKNLTTIPQLNTSKGTSFNNTFNGCTSLTTISFVENCIGVYISFKYCTALSHDSLVSILNGLKPATPTQTCTLGATNLAKLTDEEKAIATQKNWTLAS